MNSLVTLKSYWIGKQYWGKGIATEALLNFLPKLKVRPLYARAAKENPASIRVLEKCGFKDSMKTKGIPMQEGKRLKNSF